MLIDQYQERNKLATRQEEKEIKVRIPLDYHIRLHTVKVVKGQNISETVKEALENYFADLRQDAPVGPSVAFK